MQVLRRTLMVTLLSQDGAEYVLQFRNAVFGVDSYALPSAVFRAVDILQMKLGHAVVEPSLGKTHAIEPEQLIRNVRQFLPLLVASSQLG